MPRVGRIVVYPLKSFEGLEVEAVGVLENGALRNDRRFALADSSGRFVNAKRTPRVHELVIRVDPEQRTLTARRRLEDQGVCWNIDSEREGLERWLSRHFELDVALIENPDGGFPDDEGAAGPTIISRATLDAVADWFPGLTVEDVRARFRANIEIEETEPFWEDCLFGPDSRERPFRVGSVLFGGTNPCQRCVVPTRDPVTGSVTPEFAQRFALMREKQLPSWAARGRFEHFYRLATNTKRLDTGPGVIRVGDLVELA